MKLQLLAIPLLVALMASPMLASATTGSISFSSPASGAQLSGTQSYTISGTISPTPSLPDNVVITVTLQGGSPSPLDETTVAAGAGGAFSYATNAGGSAAWVTGTYVISAFDSNGATGTTTFHYQATGTTGTPSTGYVTVVAPSLLLPGQSGNIFIWSSAPGSVTAWVLASGASSTTALTATRVSPNPGGLYVYSATYAVSSTAANGVYLVGASVSNSTSLFSASNIGSFTVNGGVASASAVSAIATSITGLQTTITGLQSSLTGISNSISSLGKNVSSGFASVNSAVSVVGTSVTSLSGINSQLTTIGNNVQSIQSGLTSLTTTVNGISSSLTSLTNTVNGIQSTLNSITGSIQTLTTDVTGMQTTVSGLSGLSGQMTTLNNSVSNSQTYILVVAALVVITLVLELAILIRKMS